MDDEMRRCMIKIVMKLSMTVEDFYYTTLCKSACTHSPFGKRTVEKMSEFRYLKGEKSHTYLITYFMPYNAISYDSQPPDFIPVYNLYASSPDTHSRGIHVVFTTHITYV